MNQINSLETFIGTKLFQRTNRGVILTDAGKSFYRDAKKIFRLCQEAVGKAQRIGENIGQVINIGTSIMRPCNHFIEKLSTCLNNPYSFNIVPFNDEMRYRHVRQAFFGRKKNSSLGRLAQSNSLAAKARKLLRPRPNAR